MSKFLLLQLVHISVSIAVSLLFSTLSYSQIIFEADIENGKLPGLGGEPAHPGGGKIIFLGGELSTYPNFGDGSGSLSVQDVVPDNSTEAQGSIPGSNWALKTHYKAGNSASFQKNTTIISFPETDILFVRWYQKWGADWQWPSNQQKLIKLKGPSTSQNFPITNGNNYIHLTYDSPQTYVYAAPIGSLNVDSINNMLGPGDTDINLLLDTNRWYAIEVMVKLNTPGFDDGEYKYWVDGKLAFHLKDTNVRSDTAGLNIIELQHVRQDRNDPTTIDMPTWMDNIVLSREYIGLVVPEPSSMALVGLGLAMIAIKRRYFRV